MDLTPIIGAIAKLIETLFSRPENIALLVSVAANFGLGWFILRSRQEDREDRKSFIDTLSKLTDALVKLRIAFAAAGIKGENET